MRNILLLASLLLPARFLFAQEKQPASEFTPVLNHIAVYVSDLKKSTAFYEAVLHLRQIPEPFKDGLHTWFTLGAAGQLHLIQGQKAEFLRNKNEHLCFSVPSVDQFITVLSQSGIGYTNWPGNEKAPTVRVDGVKQIYFQDPDGHWIEVNDDYPKQTNKK